jgi:hypothetical protein
MSLDRRVDHVLVGDDIQQGVKKVYVSRDRDLKWAVVNTVMNSLFP